MKSATVVGIHNGRLLLSLKSTYTTCGKEEIEPSDLPSEFLAYGIQVVLAALLIYCHTMHAVMYMRVFISNAHILFCIIISIIKTLNDSTRS